MASPASLFGRGNEVEVSSDDPDFTGAWFEAKVVRHGAKKRRLSVVYDRMVDESDPSKPHREIVDLNHVRPRPPPEKTRPPFRVGDKVEAFYHDCWWAGEVQKVLDASSSYIVRCLDGDVLEFLRSDLRPRLDWDHGKWVSIPNSLDMGHFLSNCSIDDPVSGLEEKLEILAGSQVYNVEAIRSRIKELLNVKRRLTQCTCKLDELESRMLKKKHIIVGMNMDIVELEENLARLDRQRENSISKIEELQRAVEEMKKKSLCDSKWSQDQVDNFAALQERVLSQNDDNAEIHLRIIELQQPLTQLKRQREEEFTLVAELQREMQTISKEAQKCRQDFCKAAAASLSTM